jgi:hypothetical protein
MNYQLDHSKRIQRMNEIIRSDPDFQRGMEIRSTGSGYDLYMHDRRYQTPATSAMMSCASVQIMQEGSCLSNTTDTQ